MRILFNCRDFTKTSHLHHFFKNCVDLFYLEEVELEGIYGVVVDFDMMAGM